MSPSRPTALTSDRPQTRPSTVTTTTTLAATGSSSNHVVNKRPQLNKHRESIPSIPIHSSGSCRDPSHADNNHNPQLSSISTAGDPPPRHHQRRPDPNPPTPFPRDTERHHTYP
ncbi:hypothetical protein AX16_010569 [Volvariella volvacea WC 439]|nr:hypothetical protein AX16_010569 [Volvariella volvacea WC 439]